MVAGGRHVTALHISSLVLLSIYNGCAAALLRSSSASGVAQLVPPSGLAPVQEAPRRRCKQQPSMLQEEKMRNDSTALGFRGILVADGFSRVGCEVDVSPMSQRVYFKENACGAVSSCRLTEMPMQPRLCFDFCRQFEKAKFFGLQGTKCYCAGYYHAKSVGGQGDCSFACDGAKEEMCGGPEKSSLFEMHMCADSGEEASLALHMSEQTATSADLLLESAELLQEQLQDLGLAWKLDSCSVEPEGVRLCALGQQWSQIAATINRALVPVKQAATVLLAAQTALVDASDEVGSGTDDAAKASAMELATSDVRQAVGSAKGAASVANLTLQNIVGPMLGFVGQDAANSVFAPLGDVSAGWHALCGLVPLPGQLYAASVTGAQASCSAKCLSLSSGTEACVGFNYVERNGLSTCQLLTAAGLVEPSDSLLWAVPIIEVSQTKVTSMGIGTLGCYTHGAFMAGHARGPLKTHVVRTSTVELS